ncbi:MAG: aminoacyl-tRNA hydrolase [Clostridia bacterium]|nr:aminoacyl-tRNA hydrolase [Clostridia bacterium]
MEKQTFIVVGLGNPGAQYARTRHNAGFETLEVLSRRWGVEISRKKLGGLVAETTYNGHRVVLVLPQTYMNASGECVQPILQWYKAPLANMVVIYDDIDLALGRLRVRKSGSAGTHNGMRSILGCLGNQQGFPRIRVGVGAKPEGWDLADWVLSTYRLREEREEMEKAFVRAADCVEDWLKNGIEHAMQQYNGK